MRLGKDTRGNHEPVSVGVSLNPKRLGEPVAAGQSVIEIHAIIGNAKLAQDPALRGEVRSFGRAVRVPIRIPRTSAESFATPRREPWSSPAATSRSVNSRSSFIRSLTVLRAEP